MIPIWVLILALFFTVVLSVIVVLLMRISTNVEIIVRAIPLGAPRVQERRPPNPPEEQRTRPVGAPAPSGRHG